MNTKEKQKLRKFINELALVRGRHTELVSVYIPTGYDIIKIIQHLEQEQGTASNIKDAKTRKNVKDSLEKLIRHLRLFKKTPPNGLAAFAGNVSAQAGKVNLKVWSIEPPEQLKTRIYRCDQTFLLDLLRGMMESKERYGLIVMDRREATLGVLRGTNLKVLAHMTSNVPGKTTKGGQCCIFNTLIETNSQTPLSKLRVGDQLKSYNFKENKIIKSKIIDRWIVKKDETVKIITEDNTTISTSKDHLFFTENQKQKPAEDLTLDNSLLKIKNNKAYPIKIKSIKINKKPIKMIDISVQNHNFIANGLIVHNSAARYARIREGAAKEFYKRISEAANKEFLGKKDLKGVLLGGPGPTKEDFKEYLNQELQDKILVVQDLTYTDESGLHHLVDKSQDIFAKTAIAEEKAILKRFFETLAKEPDKVAYGEKQVEKVLEMGAVETLLLSENLSDKKIEKFEALADRTAAKLMLISVDTAEGKQLKDLTGIAAILRYSLKV